MEAKIAHIREIPIDVASSCVAETQNMMSRRFSSLLRMLREVSGRNTSGFDVRAKIVTSAALHVIRSVSFLFQFVTPNTLWLSSAFYMVAFLEDVILLSLFLNLFPAGKRVDNVQSRCTRGRECCRKDSCHDEQPQTDIEIKQTRDSHRQTLANHRQRLHVQSQSCHIQRPSESLSVRHEQLIKKADALHKTNSLVSQTHNEQHDKKRNTQSAAACQQTNERSEQLPGRQPCLQGDSSESTSTTVIVEIKSGNTTVKQTAQLPPDHEHNNEGGHNDQQAVKVPLLSDNGSADVTARTTSKKGHPGSISSNFLLASLKLIKDAEEQSNPCCHDHSGKTKQDLQMDTSGPARADSGILPTDAKSIIMKELTAFSAAHSFAPEVDGQVYMCIWPQQQQDDLQIRLWDETSRLASFAMYQTPPPSGVWFTRLSQAGFFCPNKDSTALRCISCDISVEMDQFIGKDAMQLHRQKSPSCAFANGTASHNRTAEQPSRSQAQNSASSGQIRSQLGEVTEQSSRSQAQDSASSGHPQPNGPQLTEVAAPHHPGASGMTQTGLETAPPLQTAQYINTHQEEEAPSMDGPASAIEGATDTSGRGADNRQSPSSTDMPPAAATPQTGPSEAASSAGPVTYRQLGIYTEEPRRRDFAIASSRLNTYTSAWRHSATHSPSEMAAAGFYFVGESDLVRCFYCKGGLKSWSQALRPWVEHARFYPKCPFVGQVRGQEFITIVQDLHKKSETISEKEVEKELEKRSRKEQAKNKHAAAAVEVDAAPGIEDGGELDLTKTADELEDENDVIKNERLCKICQTEEVSILFLPCGHLVSCAQCAPALRSCAICRQRVKGRVRVLDPDVDNDSLKNEEVV